MPKLYHIDIDSTIGFPISKGYVKQKMAGMDGKPVDVRINSYGGDVQTALDIRQQFLDHGNVTAYIYGMTASAATILAMGAKKIVMSRYAMMLVHKCSGWMETWGSYNEEQLEAAILEMLKTKAELVTIDELIASIYALRTHRTAKEMATVMAEARWLTADECLKLGLVDEILEEAGDAPQPLSASMKEHFTACGLPIPEEAIPEGHESPTGGRTCPTAESEATTLLEKLKAIFSPKQKPNPSNEEKEMDKKTKPIACALICAAAQIEGEHLEADSEGRVSLTAEQLEAIEARLSALEAENKKLQKEDGADTQDVDPANASESLPGAEAAEFYRKFEDII